MNPVNNPPQNLLKLQFNEALFKLNQRIQDMSDEELNQLIAGTCVSNSFLKTTDKEDDSFDIINVLLKVRKASYPREKDGSS